MSNRGPAPSAKRNDALGWNTSGPWYCMVVVAVSGVPMTRPRWRAWPPASRCEHRVGSHPEQQPGLAGEVDQALRRLARQADRLLGPHVLAGAQRRGRDLDVRGGQREVDDDLDVVVGEQLRHGPRARDGEPLRLRGGAGDVDVADEHDLHVGETASGGSGTAPRSSRHR